MLLQDLEEGNYSRVSKSLQGILTRLVRLGYKIVEVHTTSEKAEDFEIVLDKPIRHDLEKLFENDQRIIIFDDADMSGRITGIGMSCRETNQMITGKNW